MCGRFNQEETLERLSQERHFARLDRERLKYNISPGMYAYIKTSQTKLEDAKFGLVPSWNPKILLINARAEGKGNEQNLKENWEVGINKMPAYRSAFKSRRCVIPVTGFLEGPEKEKLSKPFLVSAIDNRVFYLGGIYELFTNEDTGEQYPTFAIITKPSNYLTDVIGHHRTPLMLSAESADHWLEFETNEKVLFDILKSTFVEPNMKVTPLNPALVKSGKLHTAETMQPFGETIFFED